MKMMAFWNAWEGRVLAGELYRNGKFISKLRASLSVKIKATH